MCWGEDHKNPPWYREENVKTKFYSGEVGDLLERVSLKDINPSQPDSGDPSSSWEKPIECYIRDGKLYVLNGNHRVHEAWRMGIISLDVRIVRDEHLEC